MIRSMTAFGRSESHTEQATLIWELRSVNHRYLEMNFRLPEGLRELENAAREQVRKTLSRGKVDLALRYQAPAELQSDIEIDEALAAKLAAAAQSLAGTIENAAAVNTTEILRFPGVVKSGELDFKAMQKVALDGLKDALKQMVANREREGEALAKMINDRLATMGDQVNTAEGAVSEIIQANKQKLRDRLAELKGELNEDRIEQELVHMAQRMDIDEEIDRLRTHITEVTNVLKKGGACGRRLDFLMQELNREANTLGSKSASSVTTGVSVELKVLIEQMREQVQNIE